jgi:UDP-galactopyranose mutase
MKKYLIVGSGFAGSIIAEQLAHNSQIEIWEERSHIGGNCYTERDSETKVNIHTYGPHIFNTDNPEIWNYLAQFCELMPYTNRVKSVYKGQVYSLPINLHTINQFFGKALTPAEAKEFIASLSDSSIIEPKNFEEQALKFIGEDLYRAFFYGYTKKQWGCEPRELPASILKRLPVRFNYNDNYYAMPMQGIPKNGYTEIFERMLNHPNIQVKLNKKFVPTEVELSDYDQVFYTGPIDAYFDYKYGRLGYRTVFFEGAVADGDYQGNAVINYADEETPYTRIHEHKHFAPWETHEKTNYFKEFSKETEANDIPYYPKRLANDMEILAKYTAEVDKLNNVTFLGRLATYRYMDMQHVIANALEVAALFKNQ